MKPFLEEAKTIDGYDYSSTQINLPADLAAQVMAWSKENVPDAVLTGPGREEEPHVTLKYGLLTTDPEEVRAVLKANPVSPVVVTLGKVSIFDLPEYDVVKIDVSSPALAVLNEAISKSIGMKSLPNEDRNPVYRPHITVAYARKGTVGSLVGREDFEGLEFTANEVLFTGKDGTRERMKIEIVEEKATNQYKLLVSPGMSDDELISILYRGSNYTFAELDAAKELKKRGRVEVLKEAADDERYQTSSAAKYVLGRSDYSLGIEKSIKGGIEDIPVLEFYTQYTQHGVIPPDLDVFYHGDQVESLERSVGGVMLHLRYGRTQAVRAGELLEVQAYA